MLNRPLLSSKQVILKIVRDLGLGDTAIPWQDMVEWIAEGMQHIGAYTQLEQKEADIEIRNFSGKLPCDFYAEATNQVAYKITGDTIICKLQSGYLTKFRYLAMPVDEEGYPLIPDHVSYTTALFWKVAMQLAIRGQLPNKDITYQVCQSRWSWYCKQAGAYSQPMNHQAMARFANIFLARIPDMEQQAKGFPAINNTVSRG